MTEPVDDGPNRVTPLPSSSSGRALYGYGPLAGFLLLVALMAVFLPSVDHEPRIIETDATGAPLDGNGRGAIDGTDGGAAAGGGISGSPGAAVLGSGQSGSGAGGTSGQAGRAGTAEQRIAGGQLGGAQPCADRDRQVPADPYSPVCIAFAGNNGGATTRGVTADTILVSRRDVGGVGLDQAIGSVDTTQIDDSREAIDRTFDGLVEYFNNAFQFYGRKLELVTFKGRGDATNELLFGRGQEQAEADAVVAADEVGAFADITGTTAPYADALARRDVIAFGTPYLSREWHLERAPYNWSNYTDCTVIAESVAAFVAAQLGGRKAEFAGTAYVDKTRRFGIMAPENPWYQECVAHGRNLLKAAGFAPAVEIAYKLDIDTATTQAANAIAKLKGNDITTVFCLCDPIAPIFLTAKATEQNYEPEWVHGGTAFIDLDPLAQQYDQDQWSHAFGLSFLSTLTPRRAGLGYQAYKAVRDDEPSSAVELLYSQFYLLALGVHLAGPNLTANTFEAGLRSYQGGSGQFGNWGFSAPNYTPTTDFRLVWWDPDATSQFNGNAGAYIEAYGAERFSQADVPTTSDFFGR